MKYIFIIIVFLSFNANSQLDSTQITKIVRLINDFKACKEYSAELEDRLITARNLLSRTVEERNEYESLLTEVNKALKEMTARNEKLERKLKRTRRIGLIGTFGGLIVGVLVVLII